MHSPDICASITSVNDVGTAIAARDYVALYEVRIDLIGPTWRHIVRDLPRPWIACNRIPSEGGQALEPEPERCAVLREAADLGADVIDIELLAPGLSDVLEWAKGRTLVLISYHDLNATPCEEMLDGVVSRQCAAGADINKVVTTAEAQGDNVTMLRLIRRHPHLSMVSFAMGSVGMASRVLAPLVGARFTYASLAEGSEAAPGQLTVDNLHAMYEMLGVLE